MYYISTEIELYRCGWGGVGIAPFASRKLRHWNKHMIYSFIVSFLSSFIVANDVAVVNSSSTMFCYES
jgi:hypothetical protein